MKEYRIGYESNAGSSAEIYVEMADNDIEVLLDKEGSFPIVHTTVKDVLPNLYQRIMSACQSQEDECIESGIYDIDEYEDREPGDFIVNAFHIFDD